MRRLSISPGGYGALRATRRLSYQTERWGAAHFEPAQNEPAQNEPVILFSLQKKVNYAFYIRLTIWFYFVTKQPRRNEYS